MRVTALLSLGIALTLAGFRQAAASSITYSESITTDGSLGGSAFTGKLVTLSFTADTANVSFFQGSNFRQYTNVPTTSVVTVAGIGSATFNDPMSLSVFAYPTFSEFSVTDTATSTDVLDTFATASGFAGYDMTTDFGPISGGAAYSVATPFSTSLGDFDFTKSGGGVSGVVAVTPEPAALGLMMMALFGAMIPRRRALR